MYVVCMSVYLCVHTCDFMRICVFMYMYGYVKCVCPGRLVLLQNAPFST